MPDPAEVLDGAHKALEHFKDWSNYLLVTTVAALGWANLGARAAAQQRIRELADDPSEVVRLVVGLQ